MIRIENLKAGPHKQSVDLKGNRVNLIDCQIANLMIFLPGVLAWTSKNFLSQITVTEDTLEFMVFAGERFFSPHDFNFWNLKHIWYNVIEWNPVLSVDHILRSYQFFIVLTQNFGIALDVKNKRDLKRDGSDFRN